MKSFETFLLANKAWSQEKLVTDPVFFGQFSRTQKPEFLWVGCSDSRVLAEVIVNAKPGGILIHCNIANQITATDFNCLSVLPYAVDCVVWHVNSSLKRLSLVSYHYEMECTCSA